MYRKFIFFSLKAAPASSHLTEFFWMVVVRDPALWVQARGAQWCSFCQKKACPPQEDWQLKFWELQLAGNKEAELDFFFKASDRLSHRTHLVETPVGPAGNKSQDEFLQAFRSTVLSFFFLFFFFMRAEIRWCFEVAHN